MEAFFQLRKVDEEKRLVYGRATQEIVDRSGEIMDYETSKPLIEAWSLDASAASGGLSKGNVRSQHRKDSAAEKVVEIEFDDTSKWVDVAVKVVDDADWKKVQEGVYTGFSMGGSYAKKWSDPTLTTASGRPVVRYTAQPSEISLVDRPCVPTAGFFEVLKADGSTEQKAFHQGENNMSTETPPVEAPGQELAKGLYEAKGLIQAVQDLRYLHSGIGEGGKIGADLEEHIREVGQLALSYLAEELGEHIGLTVDDSTDIDAMIGAASETDMDTDEDGEPISVEKGDFPGHPFRGNQHRRGGKAGAHHGASRSAHLASVRAHKAGDKSSHRAAANYHRQAASAHGKAGNTKMVSHHKEQARYHMGAAGPGGVGKADGGDDLQKAARNGRKALRGELGEALAKCNELHKSYIDTYAKGDDEDAEKAESVVDLVKSDDLDGRIAAAVAAALAPHLETLTKSAPVAPVAPQRPHLRALDKADDGLTPRGEDPNAELRKAAENGDSLAAIKLAHQNPTRI